MLTLYAATSRDAEDTAGDARLLDPSGEGASDRMVRMYVHLKSDLKIRSLMFARPSKIFVWGA